MCESIREWYQIHGYTLCASGLHIWQWGEEDPTHFLNRVFSWLREITVVDARVHTQSCLGNAVHQQAPCRSCSDIRRYFSDHYLAQMKTDYPVLLCRGLHLTDIAVSVLWRLVWYGSDNQLEGKGQPITTLFQNIYLAKPLCFVREYECQSYAEQKNYIPFICNCPAQTYPSRRDIVEESLRQFYTSSLWEFDVPGISWYLRHTAGISDIELLKMLSTPGVERKQALIPDGYYEFARDHFLRLASLPSDHRMLLENLAADYLRSGRYASVDGYDMTCKLLSMPFSLSSFDLRMIGTLGPFWGAFSLPNPQRKYFWQLQQKIWNFTPTSDWSQVYLLLKCYYEK